MNRFTLSKKQRLSDPKIFRELFASEQKIFTPFFVVRFRDSGGSHARLGLVLSKKKIAERSIEIA